jgi:hypothetical protein
VKVSAPEAKQTKIITTKETMTTSYTVFINKNRNHPIDIQSKEHAGFP